jgi:hypothetical protein
MKRKAKKALSKKDALFTLLAAEGYRELTRDGYQRVCESLDALRIGVDGKKCVLQRFGYAGATGVILKRYRAPK